MGKREEQQKQEPLWIAHAELSAAPGHPFYDKLNELLDGERFDSFVEALSTKFYAAAVRAPIAGARGLLSFALDRVF